MPEQAKNKVKVMNQTGGDITDCKRLPDLSSYFLTPNGEREQLVREKSSSGQDPLYLNVCASATLSLGETLFTRYHFVFTLHLSQHH